MMNSSNSQTEHQDYSSILKQREQEYAQQAVDRFVRRFEPSYRRLVYYAALPLVLTPELVNYLRNQFLREENVPWVAEVDLLLSDLCSQVGHELYAMDTAVRAYALSAMRQEVGIKRMQDVARLLISYVQQLSRTNPYIGKHELQAQQWAAMAYLDDKREDAVREIAESFRNSVASADETARGVSAMADRAEMLRLSRLVQKLSPELKQYSDLVEYAKYVTQLLTDPARMRREDLYRKREVLGEELPELGRLAPQPEEKPGEWTDPLIGMEFVWVPAGRFQMGQTEVDREYLIQELGKEKYKEYGYYKELPRHEVHVDGFWMGKYPVTQGQWLEMMGENPSYFAESPRPRNEEELGEDWRNHPVEQVSWDNVQEFLRKLNEKLVGTTSEVAPIFRLPSEAEWEYPCRAGAETMFCFGDDIEQLKDYAWYGEYWEGTTHPVGQLKSNAWGLYDMHGNVWEWCADPWHDNYEGTPENGRVWEEKRDTYLRLLRGGAWLDDPMDLRCACRHWGWHSPWDNGRGFRLVRSCGGQ